MTWTSRVEFRKSPVHGMGVFAIEDIPAGTRVWEFDRKMMIADGPEALLRLPSPVRHFALHGGYLHHPSDRFVWYTDGMQYVNHAFGEMSNIGITEWTPLEQDNCTALRDIAAGDELLEDYSFWSIAKLPTDHWLRQVYADHCPHHYDFLLGLDGQKDALRVA